MEIKLTEEALKDREKYSEEEWKEIKSKIKEISTQLSHEDLKLIPNPLLKHPIWQLTIDEENTNHRAYIDIKNGELVVLAIWDFEFTHKGNQHWKKLEERI